MTVWQSVQSGLRNYATYSGRASRPEYWWFVAFCIAGTLAAYGLETAINTVAQTADGPRILSVAFKLAVAMPLLAVTWRRFHDVGRSGLTPLALSLVLPVVALAIGAGISHLMALVPGLNAIIAPQIFIVAALATCFALLVHLLTRPGEPGENEYGFNPLEAAP